MSSARSTDPDDAGLPAPRTGVPRVPGGKRPSPELVGGPIGRTLFLFSLPILGSSILQSLNASINAIWIGQLLGPSALSAGANANSVLFFLISVGFGIGMAATILIGQGLGSHDVDQVKRTVGTTSVFFTLLSVAIGLTGFVAAPVLLARVMSTPPDVLPMAAAYLKSSSSHCPASISTPSSCRPCAVPAIRARRSSFSRSRRRWTSASIRSSFAGSAPSRRWASPGRRWQP
jgi:hypothetical protein